MVTDDNGQVITKVKSRHWYTDDIGQEVTHAQVSIGQTYNHVSIDHTYTGIHRPHIHRYP